MSLLFMSNLCVILSGHFDGKAMPSAGVLPFLQSFFCTFNNTCHETVTQDEMPGNVGNFGKSM